MDGVDFYLLWCWCGNGIIGDDNNEEDGAEGGATNFEGREALIMDGGGNNGDGLGMSVEELVEDKVVKGVIERWRKECWVRCLLGNKSYGNRDKEG